MRHESGDKIGWDHAVKFGAIVNRGGTEEVVDVSSKSHRFARGGEGLGRDSLRGKKNENMRRQRQCLVSVHVWALEKAQLEEYVMV